MSIINQTNINNALSRLPNPSKILKDTGKTMELFAEVERQHDVFAMTNHYADTICAMDIQIDDKLFADIFLQMNRDRILRSSVSARNYGFSVLEIVTYAEYNRYIIPISVDLCPHELFFFNNAGQLRLIDKSNAQGIDLFTKYPNKFILIQHNASSFNPYGIGLLDIAYWLSVGLNGNFQFMLQFAEEDGRDRWLGKYPPGTSDQDKNELLDALSNLRNGQVAVVPEGIMIEPMQNVFRASSRELYNAINEMLLRKLEKLFYGTDLTMQQNKGGYSSSQSGIQIKEDSLAIGKQLVIQTISQLLSYTQAINKMKPTPIKVEIFSPRFTSKEEAETDQIYFNMGMTPTSQFFINRGYKTDEFSLQESTNVKKITLENPNAQDFSAIPNNSDFQSLISAFEKFTDIQKKK